MDRIAQASLNNAEWCATVWRSHELTVEQAEGAWFTRSETPKFYPNVVTVQESDDPKRQTDLIASTTRSFERFSVKDSFASLQLGSLNFSKLFDAQWLWRAPSTLAKSTSHSSCCQITDAATFANWTNAWISNGGGAQGILKPALMHEDRVQVWGEFGPDRQFNSGLVAYESADVTGVTNLFGSPHRLLGAVAAANDKPIVCYERGSGLEWAVKRGFESIGSLSVWTRTPSKLAECVNR